MCLSLPASSSFSRVPNSACEGSVPFLSPDQYDRILGRIFEGLSLLDSERRITYLNEQIAETSGVGRENTPGARFTETPGSLFDDVLGARESLLSGQDEEISFEYFHPLLNRWFTCTLSPSLDGHRPIKS